MEYIPIENIPFKELLLLLLGTLSTFLIWRVQHQKDKIRGVENQLSEKKFTMYSNMIYMIFDMIESSKRKKPLSTADLTKRIFAIKRDMFLYAPDDVFKKFTQWSIEIGRAESQVNHFKTYFEVLKLVRKDMGKQNSKLNLDDFMLFLMQNEQEYLKFKLANGW